MKKYLRNLNSENKRFMDEILLSVTRIFPVPEYCLPFIGSILYLKKIGADFILLNPDKGLVDLIYESEKLLPNDPLRDVILNVLHDVNSRVKDKELNKLLHYVGIQDFDSSEYLHWYDYAIENSSKYKNFSYQRIVPDGLISLTEAFIGTNAKKVLIPFGGLMNFATGLEKFDCIDSYELNRQAWEIGMLRMGLAGIASKVNFVSDDLRSWPKERYNTIISFPEFGQRKKIYKSLESFNANSIEYSELVAPSRFLESATDDAVCIAFAPASLLLGKSNKKEFRIWATEHKILDTVILLPGNMLNSTNIQISCIILRKKPCHTEAVRMIDATGLYKNNLNRNLLDIGELMNAYHEDKDNISRNVSYREIQDFDYSWNIKEYFTKGQICPDGFSISPLEEIVSMPRLETATNHDKGFVIKVADLSEDWSHPYINIENLSEDHILRGYSRLDKEAILVSSIRTLKPSIIKATETCPVWINPNILVIIPSKIIDAEYLCMKLSELEIQTIDTGVPHISRTYLLRQNIVYPELSIQKSLYTEGTRAIALSKAKELGLQEVIDSMKAEYINIIRTRKHDMRPYVRELGSVERLMRYYISHIQEMNDFSEKMTSLLDQYHIALNKLSELIDIFSEEDKFGKPEAFNVDKYLIDLEIKNNEAVSGYTIEYDCDDNALQEYGLPVHRYWSNPSSLLNELDSIKAGLMKDDDIPLIVDIAPLDFERMVLNIIENARIHGFTDKNRDDYFIGIDLTINFEKDMFQIDFSNNGTPLPKGMDKKRYGLLGEKASITGGSGQGGYVVKSIVEHYHGDYDVFMDGENTVVRILLPISKQYGE